MRVISISGTDQNGWHEPSNYILILAVERPRRRNPEPGDKNYPTDQQSKKKSLCTYEGMGPRYNLSFDRQRLAKICNEFEVAERRQNSEDHKGIDQPRLPHLE